MQSLACLLIVTLATERDHKSKLYAEGAIPMLKSLMVAGHVKTPVLETGRPSCTTSAHLARTALEHLGVDITPEGLLGPVMSADGITGK